MRWPHAAEEDDAYFTNDRIGFLSHQGDQSRNCRDAVRVAMPSSSSTTRGSPILSGFGNRRLARIQVPPSLTSVMFLLLPFRRHGLFRMAFFPYSSFFRQQPRAAIYRIGTGHLARIVRPRTSLRPRFDTSCREIGIRFATHPFPGWRSQGDGAAS